LAWRRGENRTTRRGDGPPHPVSADRRGGSDKTGSPSDRLLAQAPRRPARPSTSWNGSWPSWPAPTSGHESSPQATRKPDGPLAGRCVGTGRSGAPVRALTIAGLPEVLWVRSPSTGDRRLPGTTRAVVFANGQRRAQGEALARAALMAHPSGRWLPRHLDPPVPVHRLVKGPSGSKQLTGPGERLASY
jgi:hypothetical protein